MTIRIIRGNIMHVINNPFVVGDEAALESFPMGAIAINTEKGTVLRVGTILNLWNEFGGDGVEVVDRWDCYILPGFVDCHIHYPQTLMPAAYGEELLQWLTKHTFPEEAKYADPDYAHTAAELLFDELIANGTTTANVFGSQFPAAMHIAFRVARERNFRTVMGLNLSDRHIPEALQLSPEEAYRLSRGLIERWHGGKQLYAVTPRFAPTSTPQQLEVCGRLLREFPEVYLHTHLDESRAEIAWMKELFPNESYLGVYDRFGLVGPQSVFAHCVHSDQRTIDRLASADCGVAHCPSSNMFLGSGLMPLRHFVKAFARLGLGTDVGAGTGFSMFKEMSGAYQIQMLCRGMGFGDTGTVIPTGAKLLYLATLGGARALHLEDKIGSFLPGNAADIVVINPERDNYLPFRLEKNTTSDAEKLFALAILGGKSVIDEVYIGGKSVHQAYPRRMRQGQPIPLGQ